MYLNIVLLLFSMAFLFLAMGAHAITLRAHQHQRMHARLESFPAVLMPRGVMTCPNGQQIMSQSDCDAAFSTIITKYDYDSADAEPAKALLVSRPHLPKGCSVSKGKAYFNTDASQLMGGDSAVGGTLSFHVVCRPAAYKEFARTKFCKGTVLYNGGAAAAQAKLKDMASCQEQCDQDPRCYFFLWKHEPGTSWALHCATFTDCHSPDAYTDGKTAVLFEKLPAPAPAPAPDDLASNKVIYFHRLGKESSGARSVADAFVPPAAPAAAAAHADVAWFACQLEDGNERIVWTAKNMVVMTRTIRKPNCGGPARLHCTQNYFYTGSWSIEDANVVLEWDYLPPMRLSTVDGGQHFLFDFRGKAKKYDCTTPPRNLTTLIKAGIKRAERKLEAKQRTKAGLPSDYTQHGCREFPVQPLKPLVDGRGMTLGKCFAHCSKTKGIYYFSVTRGDSCFCSATPPGKLVSATNCDLTCSGNEKEYCGGFSFYASVYTMIDCLPPGPQEKKEEKAAAVARLHALYSKNSSQSCGQAKGNEVVIAGAKVFTGHPNECEQLCFSAVGAGKCHGFTFNEKYSRCIFHLDAFWGKPAKDPFSSCYYKKSIPLLAK